MPFGFEMQIISVYFVIKSTFIRVVNDRGR